MGQNQESDGYGIQKGNVNVVVRVRPLNNSERFANESNVLQFPGNGGIVATSQDKGNVIKSFTFNVVFEPEATQKDVFEILQKEKSQNCRYLLGGIRWYLE